MNKTLNDQQRKLVEDNHNLIYSFLKSKNLSLDAVEDWYGTAAIGLCKAALCYDESRNARFSTLAYIIMENEVRQVMRSNRKNVQDCLYLDTELDTADRKDNFFQIFLQDALSKATEKLSERDKQIVEYITGSGAKQREVAVRFGLSRTYISKIYNDFLKSIKFYLYEK